MSSSSEEIEIRFAPYIEQNHSSLLWWIAEYRKQLTIDRPSPYVEYDYLRIEDAFFSTGYFLTDFPSLYDMFGKFMAGLDIDILYKEIFGETLTKSEINPYLQSEAAMIDMDIISKIIPVFSNTLRKLNAVISSSFIIGKANIETKRIKVLAKISSNLKYHLIPLITERWKTSLDWNKNIVTLYAFNLKLYFMSKMAVDEMNYGKEMKNSIWPFTVMEYERRVLATLTGNAVQRRSNERSAVSKGLLVCSYTVQGAAIGSYFPPYGTIIGGIIGFIIGVAIMLLE